MPATSSIKLTDIRLKSLSYSSRLLLHACPKKFQLYRLNSKAQEDNDVYQSVTFSFGQVVGLGIQEYITHHKLDLAIWKCFLMWEPDLLAENTKQNKSFWLALSAVQKFTAICEAGFLSDWELAYYNGLPATELSFIIHLPDGFTYKGFVDACLVNKQTKEVMVLEVKTTSSSYVAGAAYKNSAQAIGYSIVLDALFPELSSYKVQYLVYKTKVAEYEALAFEKDYLARALWIREILLDIEFIKMCEEASIYPMHGESCNDFFRECEYLNLCTLSVANLTEPLTKEQEDAIHKEHAEGFQISLTLNDLIEAQFKRS